MKKVKDKPQVTILVEECRECSGEEQKLQEIKDRASLAVTLEGLKGYSGQEREDRALDLMDLSQEELQRRVLNQETPEPPILKVSGFIPEPPNPDHWMFEDKLKSRLPYMTSGDVDLRPFSSPCQDQRQTSSCVAHAVVKALELKRIMKYGIEAHKDLSILAVYYLSRELMFPKQIGVDEGTYISLACDTLRRFGVPLESDWPFDVTKTTISPSFMAMRNAYLHKIAGFYRIGASGDQRVADIIRCLQAGNPVVYGTVIGTNWFKYKAGEVLDIPTDNQGGHATVLVGYVNGKFIGENSWGSRWGENGFYEITEDYIKWEKSCDFWTITAPWEEIQ